STFLTDEKKSAKFGDLRISFHKQVFKPEPKEALIYMKYTYHFSALQAYQVLWFGVKNRKELYEQIRGASTCTLT
ncbi:hypothetical protein, partial [Vibrio parahaemolyticus]|uniref:hypothetical protein n=1 Tax=Vibrio parahaemolyticus TaxID=670 RepID=UPI001BB04B6A